MESALRVGMGFSIALSCNPGRAGRTGREGNGFSGEDLKNDNIGRENVMCLMRRCIIFLDLVVFCEKELGKEIVSI